MEVTEGAVTLELPDRDLPDGGPARRSSAFHNPAMAASRDVGVLIHRVLDVDRVLDGLAGAGARGLRLAAEAGVDVHLNDVDPDAVEAIEAAAERNGLDVEVTRADLADVLAAGGPWGAIDVDPYGTPRSWFEPVLAALDPGDVLAVSATDTAVLHGRHPDVVRDRYGARLVRQEAEKEVGLRILLGSLARVTAAAELGVRPLLAFELGHHVRAWVRVTGDPAEALGAAHRCPDCRHAWLEGGRPCRCGTATETSGPLWTGRLLDPDLVDALAVGHPTLADRATVARLVGRLREEAGGAPLFVDVHGIGRQRGCSVPSMAALLDALREEGYAASRTHFVDTGVRTDAPRRVVGDVVEKLAV